MSTKYVLPTKENREIIESVTKIVGLLATEALASENTRSEEYVAFVTLAHTLSAHGLLNLLNEAAAHVAKYLPAQ